MDIEERKKLEKEALAILENVASERNIEFGELRFIVSAGKIRDWKFTEHIKLKDLTKT